MTKAAEMNIALKAYEDGLRPDARSALDLAQCDDLEALKRTARALRDRAHGATLTYSPKVFIPLTQLCRDVCHYCVFAKSPRQVEPYLSVDEAVEIARRGAAAGCHEALFTLGDKPELRYPRARRALDALGYPSTIAYLADAAKAVRAQTGLLPHLNAGVMTTEELQQLRKVSVSQGLMLESSSERLCERGMPHHGSPDKRPKARLQVIEDAGKLSIPFTSGILIGIGESRLERVEALLALRELADRYGHIQELIIQNFRRKPGTRMHSAPEPTVEDLQWTIAVARILFGPQANIQAPPNLTPEGVGALLEAGINDLGGISPVTIDHVNPEAPWPHLRMLERVASAHGMELTPRLPIYPELARELETWVDPDLAQPVRDRIDGSGFARGNDWSPGSGLNPPPLPEMPSPARVGRFIASNVYSHVRAAQAGKRLSEKEVTELFEVRGREARILYAAADELRMAVNGDAVGYVPNCNINYTNVCTYKCTFCAFSKHTGSRSLRGKSYLLDLDEIRDRAREAYARGAHEVCLQGGIHPKFDGTTYLEICKTIHETQPELHIHAFSPLEIWHGATTLGLSLVEYLSALRDVGLASLPGTAAEILDDPLRQRLCPDKLTVAQWGAVMEAAHSVGLRSTSTIMYGHIDAPAHWARHLLFIRDLQERTGGFTEFVPLPFVHMEAPLYHRGGARRGPTFHEAVMMHAVARLVLHPLIGNIQTSWVKMGELGVQACLNAGANDLGGTLMYESISRAAGASHGQEMTPEMMESLIRSIGRMPYRRSTLYSPIEPRPYLSREQLSHSGGAAVAV